MKKLLKFPLNIQLFNDGGTNGDGGTTTTTTQTNGDGKVNVKETPEYLQLKNQFDKLASEIAGLKKKEKEALPELDQLRQDLELQKQATAEAQKEILHSKITNKFISAGFDEKTTQGFITAFTNEDRLVFIDELIKGFNARIETIKAEVKAEFQASQTVPLGNNNQEKGTNIDDILQYKSTTSGKSPLDIIYKK